MKRTITVIIIILLLIFPSCSEKSVSSLHKEGDTGIISPPSDISETIEKLNRTKNAVYSESPESYDFIMNYIVIPASETADDLLYYDKEKAAGFIEEIESAVIVGGYRKDGKIPDIKFFEDGHCVVQDIFIGSSECFSTVYISSYTQKSEKFDGFNPKNNNNVSYSKSIKINGQSMTVCKLQNSFPIDYEVYFKTDDRCMIFSFDATENFGFKELKDALETLKFIKIGDLMKEAENATE